MGGRQKQSTKTPAKKATPKSNPELCIRCPDRETAEKRSHHNDLDKCFNDFPSRQVGNTPATHTVDQLWWGFSSGKVSADLKLSKPLVREAFFEYAKTVGEKFRPELMDSEIEERNKAVGLVAAKRDAEWKIPQEGRVISISKEALEAAFGAVQRETERKKAETENLKAEKGMRKTGASVLDQDAASAGSATGAAGIRPASAAAGSGKPPGKPSADLKGAGTGTGKPSTDGKTGNSGGGSGQGIPLRDGPPTSSGTADPTRTTQSVCPRCPVGSPHSHARAIAPDGLLDCYEEIRPGIGRTLAPHLSDLWPRLTLTRHDMLPHQLVGHDGLDARLRRGDPGLAKAVVEVLQGGGTQHGGALLTGGMAEYALVLYHQAQRQPAILDESDLEDGGPSKVAPPAQMPIASTYSNPKHTNQMTGRHTTSSLWSTFEASRLACCEILAATRTT